VETGYNLSRLTHAYGDSANSDRYCKYFHNSG
jgi:hypothetical protein